MRGKFRFFDPDTAGNPSGHEAMDVRQRDRRLFKIDSEDLKGERIPPEIRMEATVVPSDRDSH